jgi:hypothetical protein
LRRLSSDASERSVLVRARQREPARQVSRNARRRPHRLAVLGIARIWGRPDMFIAVLVPVVIMVQQAPGPVAAVRGLSRRSPALSTSSRRLTACRRLASTVMRPPSGERTPDRASTVHLLSTGGPWTHIPQQRPRAVRRPLMRRVAQPSEQPPDSPRGDRDAVLRRCDSRHHRRVRPSGGHAVACACQVQLNSSQNAPSSAGSSTENGLISRMGC